jgi:hypothetical protein
MTRINNDTAVRRLVVNNIAWEGFPVIETEARGSGSNGTKSTIGDTGTAHHVSFPQKTYL